jgi:hypothetical protein
MKNTSTHLTILIALTLVLLGVRSNLVSVVAFACACVLYGLNSALEARDGDRFKELERRFELKIQSLTEKVDRLSFGGKR